MKPVLNETPSTKPNNSKGQVSKTTQAIERALRPARRQARKIAHLYGTPFYTMKNGKIVAEKP